MQSQSNPSNKCPVRVLVTGVGAIIGYGIIKSLRKADFPTYIVGMDIYHDAVGQNWCDEFVQAKYAVDPQYIVFLRDVIQKYSIDIVFFGTEQEIYRVNDAREELKDIPCKIIINRDNILQLSKDKWLTREYLVSNGMEDMAIPSVITGSYREIALRFGDRFLLKPRSSYASKGIVTVQNREEFDFYKARMGDNFMAQEIMGDSDSEFTVGVFGLGDGRHSGLISMRRKLSQEGSTAKAEVVQSDDIRKCIDRLCASLKPIGPTNFQFRMHNGVYKLLEVNPRISSSTSIRTAFGYNEAVLCVEFFLRNRIVIPTVRSGYAIRYIDEVVCCE